MAAEGFLHYGYILVFFGSMLEGDASLITAAFLAHQGKLNFGGVLATAGIASTLLNEAVYHLARSRSRKYFERRITKHPKYSRVQDWIRRRSTVLLLFCRYIFGFRLAIPAACGMTGMNPLAFSVLNIVGAALWVLPLGYVGYAFGGVIAKFWGGVRDYEWHIAVALLAIGWIFLLRYDPELRMVATLFTRTRHFAITEVVRMGRLRKIPILSQWISARSKTGSESDRYR
jgi:membrane protein DedA with SNARE-associated domain